MIRRKKWRLSGAALNSLNVQARTHREKDNAVYVACLHDGVVLDGPVGHAWRVSLPLERSLVLRGIPRTDRLRRRIRGAAGGTLVHFREQFLEPRL